MRNLMLMLITGAVLSLFNSSLQAQPKFSALSIKHEKSQSLFWESTTLDLGTINYQKPKDVEFKFTNNGSAPVLISKVKTSCGCTATSYPTEPVAPGTTAIIKARFSAKSKGKFHKTIVVTTNSEPATQVLTLKGTVE